jgi:hypothetical protein
MDPKHKGIGEKKIPPFSPINGTACALWRVLFFGDNQEKLEVSQGIMNRNSVITCDLVVSSPDGARRREKQGLISLPHMPPPAAFPGLWYERTQHYKARPYSLFFYYVISPVKTCNH